VVLRATSKGRWAYAASKMMDEFYGLAYHQEYGLPVVPFRLFNTVGPRQTGHYGMVIPRLVTRALDNERITVYGDGTQRRCFCDVVCDVADAVRAIVGLARHPDAPGKVYNIGSTEEVSIREIAERIKIMTDSSSEIVLVPDSKAYQNPGFEDMERRKPDTRRVNALLGRSSENTLEDILERVISYVREQRANATVGPIVRQAAVGGPPADYQLVSRHPKLTGYFFSTQLPFSSFSYFCSSAELKASLWLSCACLGRLFFAPSGSRVIILYGTSSSLCWPTPFVCRADDKQSSPIGARGDSGEVVPAGEIFHQFPVAPEDDPPRPRHLSHDRHGHPDGFGEVS
jgi:UDP-glucose 4-epimerase